MPTEAAFPLDHQRSALNHWATYDPLSRCNSESVVCHPSSDEPTDVLTILCSVPAIIQKRGQCTRVKWLCRSSLINKQLQSSDRESYMISFEMNKASSVHAVLTTLPSVCLDKSPAAMAWRMPPYCNLTHLLPWCPSQSGSCMSVGRCMTSCFNYHHCSCTPNWSKVFPNEHFWQAKLLWESILGRNFHEQSGDFGRERVKLNRSLRGAFSVTLVLQKNHLHKCRNIFILFVVHNWIDRYV